MSKRTDERNRWKKVQKTIKFNLAGRNVVAALLAANIKGDVETARVIREVRRGLELREVARWVDGLVEDAKAEGRPGISWEELLDAAGEPSEFALDAGRVLWLRDALAAHDWCKVKGPDGKEESQPVPPALLEAVADVADALTTALTESAA